MSTKPSVDDDIVYKYDFERQYKDLNYNFSNLIVLETLAQQRGSEATQDIRDLLEDKNEYNVSNKLHRIRISTQIIAKNPKQNGKYFSQQKKWTSPNSTLKLNSMINLNK